MLLERSHEQLLTEYRRLTEELERRVQDRTREHLGPTDVGIVEFRKMIMGAARALSAGTVPKAAAAANGYAVRAGGWIAAPEKDLATVMTERFGHRHGYVGNEHGLAD